MAAPHELQISSIINGTYVDIMHAHLKVTMMSAISRGCPWKIRAAGMQKRFEVHMHGMSMDKNIYIQAQLSDVSQASTRQETSISKIHWS